MKILSFILIITMIFFFGCKRQENRYVHDPIIFELNFDQSPNGVLNIIQINSDWNNPTFLWGIKDRIYFYLGIKGRTPEIVGDENKFLKVVIPKNTSGPIPGSQWSTKFNKTYNELTLSYRVKFDSNFCFVKGGKLPGLAGGLANSGGIKPNGMDGWSARMMFWGEGKLCFWIYHKDQPGKFGDSLFFKKNSSYFKFETSKWYTIKHHIRMNSIGKKDGLIEGFINDSLFALKSNLDFRTNSELAIDQLVFSVFLGGEGFEYESKKDENIYFDNFLLKKQ